MVWGRSSGGAPVPLLREIVAVGAPSPWHKLGLPRKCPNHSFELALPAAFRLVVLAKAPANRMMIATALAVSLSACSMSKSNLPGNDESRHLSPRLIKVGDPVPKGGGVYKVGDPYLANGKWYVPVNDRSYDRTGLASWYGDFFHGRQTANGEIYDMNALTGAHPTLPLPTYVSVTNLRNNRSVVVRINDRGPYHEGRIIDLSHKAAQVLGFYGRGTAPVRVRYLGPAPLNGDDSYERHILAQQPWAPRVVSSIAKPATRRRNMLMAAVAVSEWPVVVKKGSFERPQSGHGGRWLTASEPALAYHALHTSTR
jgi:rare lipoprotein A (peptidoglycan hydrolase)